jgi:CMP-N-acetylneuraminic acid synthetase
MENCIDEVWGIIPARGGSKTIPLKNMADLSGHPMIEYVINASKECKSITRCICSTDHEKISSFCMDKKVEVHSRPDFLSGDETPIEDVLIDLFNDIKNKEGVLPKAFVLLMPTSPFILPEHIDKCVDALLSDSDANSSQTVSTFTHNHHAYNQRVVENGYVDFRFLKERLEHHNKQNKPKFYSFGNLVATKLDAFLTSKWVFSNPSIPIEIPFRYAIDTDGPDEIEEAVWYLESGKVELPHMI